MLKLVERTSTEGIAHHRANPIRIYADDGVQVVRVMKTRELLAKTIAEAWVARPPYVIELGCGSGDITGPISDRCWVTGVDCHWEAIKRARERFPRGAWFAGSVEAFYFDHADVIVLCEILEHLTDPQTLVKAWLPKVQHCVISHPLNEPAGSALSGGDHCWSYSQEDFEGWFRMGGHELVESETFTMGGYTIILGRGRRK